MDFLWQFLIEKGINTNDLESLKYLALLLLLLPIVATLIGIARYIIGLRSLNFYAPLLITFIFFEIANSDKADPSFLRGLLYGILAYVVILLISTILYSALRRLRMHYIPKLALIIVGTSIAIMILVLLSVYFERTIFVAISPISFIALGATAEGFMSVYAKKNFRYTLSIAWESLIISIISFVIISLEPLQLFVLANPLILIIVLILINIYVGRFLGLRLTEYWRFKNILLQEESPINEQPRTDSSK